MTSASKEETAHHLHELSVSLGITREYHDGTGQWRRASDEALVEVLKALGAPLERVEDAGEARRAIDAERSRDDLPTLVCLPSGQSGEVLVPSAITGSARLLLETGETQVVRLESANRGPRRVLFGGDLPTGYHRLEFPDDRSACAVRVLIAPRSLPRAARAWSLFAPLYGIRRGTGTATGTGTGTATGADTDTDTDTAAAFATYADLARVGQWMTSHATASKNARDTAFVATLPLLACFFEEPFEPSPYSPISRAFWSELYVDPRSVPEAATSDLPAAAGQRAQPGSRLDYREAMRERRGQIETLLHTLDGGGHPARRQHFERALETDSELVRYAEFRAAVERHGGTWEAWPAGPRSGNLRAGADYDGEVFRYHAYAQWLAREQVAKAASSGANLYLDFPVGAHSGGYDTWRHSDDFVHGVSAGAPPDAVFEGGQSWGFPPLHPQRARRSGYRALRDALRHHFEHAALLRVDHVMGLHRLFWVPSGFTAADGVYVHYRSTELWGILALEASRARAGLGAAVVGEDLGTVPDEVRREMETRGALRMHVIPFESGARRHRAINDPPSTALACLGTHDMDPFATWWNAAPTPREEIASFLGCSTDASDVLQHLISWMADSDAAVVCVNLEDLWLETERQNQPGTGSDFGNWQRPLRLGFDQFTRDQRVLALLERLRGSASTPGAEHS